MIEPTHHAVSVSLIDQALEIISSVESKITINIPSGDFFYDPWFIKPEFVGTVWEEILNSLNEIQGEARIITLPSKNNYVCHSDIDDRWHLNLSGVNCFLLDIENRHMYESVRNGRWYLMNAGRIHTAANFGNRYRHQLVVRKLLNKNKLHDYIRIKIVPLIADFDEVRFEFDNRLSSLLNWGNKNSKLTNFKLENQLPIFDCDRNFLEIIKENLGNYLGIENL